MGHYLIRRFEQHPGLGAGSETTLYGPTTAPNPEEAIRKNDISTVPTVHGGKVAITVYELSDDGEGNAVVYQKDDLELDKDYPDL